MYWWLGLWMVTVTAVLSGVAFSIFIQVVDLDRRRFFESVNPIPQSWDPSKLYGWGRGKSWAGELGLRLSGWAAGAWRSGENRGGALRRRLFQVISEEKSLKYAYWKEKLSFSGTGHALIPAAKHSEPAPPKEDSRMS